MLTPALNAPGFGIRPAIGHVDFYPNGGEQMPGCDKNAISQIVDLDGIWEGVYADYLTNSGQCHQSQHNDLIFWIQVFCFSFWRVRPQWQLQSRVKPLPNHTIFQSLFQNKQDKGLASGKCASSKVSNSRNKTYWNRAKNFEGSETRHIVLFLCNCPSAVPGGVGRWCSQPLLFGYLQLQFFWDRAINCFFNYLLQSGLH